VPANGMAAIFQFVLLLPQSEASQSKIKTP
jgi:hypothetical protein